MPSECGWQMYGWAGFRATGSRTRTYFKCLNWLFRAYSFWRDTLLSWNIEGKAMILPKINLTNYNMEYNDQNKNGLHGLIYINAWSLVGETVLAVWGCSNIEGCVQLGEDFELQNTMPFPVVFLSASRCELLKAIALVPHCQTPPLFPTMVVLDSP